MFATKLVLIPVFVTAEVNGELELFIAVVCSQWSCRSLAKHDLASTYMLVFQQDEGEKVEFPNV